MNKKVVPYRDSGDGKKKQVEQMFDGIADEYDPLNRVISLGIDQSWRRKVVREVLLGKPDRVLDMATGTGDLAISLADAGVPEVHGLDISEGMLEVGRKKVRERRLDAKVRMLKGDAEGIPAEDASYQAATVAFGVRNFENLEKGLAELHRILEPGGKLVILETSVPTQPIVRLGYRLYTHLFLPVVGRIFSRDRHAYRYLSDSAAAFPFGEAFNNILKKTGFNTVENRPQTLGVATIYVATKT